MSSITEGWTHSVGMNSKRQSGFWRLVVLIARGLRLRCPTCGDGKIFRGWFTMHDECQNCGRPFQRGPGFFLGSIYFNYGVTGLLVIVMYFSLYFSGALTDRQLLVAMTAFVLVFPLWFFRYARSLWIAFDELWDPTLAPPTAADSANQIKPPSSPSAPRNPT